MKKLEGLRKLISATLALVILGAIALFARVTPENKDTIEYIILGIVGIAGGHFAVQTLIDRDKGRNGKSNQTRQQSDNQSSDGSDSSEGNA